MMLVKPIVKSLIVSLASLILTVEASSSIGRMSSAGGRPGRFQEFSFNLTRVPENPKQYSLVLSDGDEKSISGIFTVDQLKILLALMSEAQKFAFNSESAGTKEPITTRFEDKGENAFIIDVEKSESQSKLFLTLSSEIGRMTVDAGRVSRSTRREEGFFFDLLGRLETMLPKSAKPAK